MRLPPWLWHFLASKRTRNALIIAPFALMVLAAIAYVAADKWGEAKFEKQIAALKAEGIPVTLAEAFGPPPAPEDDVFQHPELAAELALPNEQRLCRLSYLKCEGFFKPKKPTLIDPNRHELLDMRQWADPSQHSAPQKEVAQSLLHSLQPFRDRLSALSPALDRTRLNRVKEVAFTGGEYISAMQITDFSRDAALLHLAADEPDAALNNLKFCAKFRQVYLVNQPTVVSVLVANSIDGKSQQAVWQGIVQGKWNDEQLAILSTHTDAELNNRACMKALRVESAFVEKCDEAVQQAINAFSWPSWKREFWNLLKGKQYRDAGQLLAVPWQIKRPRGLWLAAAADDLRNLRVLGLGPNGSPLPSFKHADFLRFQSLDNSRISKWGTGGLHTTDSFWLLKRIAQTLLDTQTRTNLLQCGIALERYRLKHGKHPESLNALVPEFLTAVPADICDGQPLRYRVLPDGAPHVWSLWPSGKDEAGMPHRDSDKGNMVWTTGKIPGLTPEVYGRK